MCDASSSDALRVVVADDDAKTVDMLRIILQRLGHQVVGTAGHFSETLDVVRRTLPDLLLVDGFMPDDKGQTDATVGPRIAETLNRERPLAVILVSAFDADELTERAAEAGILASLQKPVHQPELGRTIRLAMARFRDLQRLRELNASLTEEVARRKAAEAALVESESLHRALMEHIPDVVLRYDRDLRHVYVSPNVRQVTGQNPEDYQGKTHAEAHCCLPSEVGMISDAILEVFETGERRDVEFLHNALEGPLNVHLRLVPELAEDGTVLTVMGLCSDVTDLTRAQGALLRSQQAAALGMFATGVAHQFNNLNMVINGTVELLLLDKTLTGQHRERLELIRGTVSRGTEIIQQLIRLGEEARLHRIDIPVHELVAAALDDERKALAEEQIELEMDIPEELTVEVDVPQVALAMRHLMTNARHAMMSRPVRRLSIAARASGDQVEVSFKDTGCGIPRNLHERVMLPFFSTKGEHASGSPQARVRGTGLGLPAAEAIAKAHGGSLVFRSLVDEGTTFVMSLPAAEQTTEPLFEPIVEAKTVLIVDDEPLIVELFNDILAESGHKVVATDTVTRGLEVLAGHEVQVVLLDLNLPGLTGEDFLQQMGAHVAGKIPQVVLTTGRVDENARRVAEEYGVISILPKPFVMADVLKQVDAAFEAWEKA